MNAKRFRIPLTLAIALAMAAGLLALVWLLGGPSPQAAHAQGPCVPGPHSGTISSDESWCLADSPHIVTGDVTVAEGVTLTIEPGVVVKFKVIAFYHDVDLIINGTLDARGTETDTIRFTSDAAVPAKGDWGTISFGDYSTGSILENVTVEYGGHDVSADTSSLTIRYSTIAYSDNDGIRLNGGAPTIEYNSIIENDGYGVNNLDGSITAYARCNWWGHASGPYHATLNPDGLGQEVSDHVVFSPWLTSPDGECIIYWVYLPVTLNNCP